MKASVVVILSLMVSGCAANSLSSTPVAASGKPQAVVCKKEKPTGSHRSVKVCRAVPGALDREDTRRDMGVLREQSVILGSPQ